MDERPEGWTRGEAPGKEDSFLQQKLQRTGERADNPCRASKHNGSSLSNNCAAGREQEEMPSVVTPHSLAPTEPRANSPSSTAIDRPRPGMLPDFSWAGPSPIAILQLHRLRSSYTWSWS